MDECIGNEFVEVRLSDGDSNIDKDDDFVDDEVIKVLKEALTKDRVVERIDLSGRQLKFLPEPFGKIHGLVVLNLSHNQLEMFEFVDVQKIGKITFKHQLSQRLSLVVGSLSLNVPGLRIHQQMSSGDYMQTISFA